MIRLYSVPDNAFESENDDLDEDDGGLCLFCYLYFKKSSSLVFLLKASLVVHNLCSFLGDELRESHGCVFGPQS